MTPLLSFVCGKDIVSSLLRVRCAVSHDSQFILSQRKPIQHLICLSNPSLPNRYIGRVIWICHIIYLKSVLCDHLVWYYLLGKKVCCRFVKFLICSSEHVLVSLSCFKDTNCSGSLSLASCLAPCISSLSAAILSNVCHFFDFCLLSTRLRLSSFSLSTDLQQ